MLNVAMVCLTYWASTPTAIILTKFDMTIHCEVRVFSLVIRYVTLALDFLTLNS